MFWLWAKISVVFSEHVSISRSQVIPKSLQRFNYPQNLKLIAFDKFEKINGDVFCNWKS